MAAPFLTAAGGPAVTVSAGSADDEERLLVRITDTS